MKGGFTIARPSKYDEWLTPDALLRIEGWARDGLTDAQIASNMGCAYSTFRDWCSKLPALSAALKKGKAPVDIEVENALLKRAKGYTVTETIEEIYQAGSGDDAHITSRHIRKVTKEIPPDPTSIIYWLNNRRPDRWRNRKASDAEQQNVALEKAREILGGVTSAID